MFKSVDQVLTFAFTISESLICKTADYAPTVTGTGERITPQDLHAQSAFIFSSMSRLREDEYLLIHAQYCFNRPVKFAASKALSESLVMPRLNGWRDVALTMTTRHFDSIARERVSQREVAFEFDISRRQVGNAERLVAEIMAPIATRAESALYEHYVSTGLIIIEN